MSTPVKNAPANRPARASSRLLRLGAVGVAAFIITFGLVTFFKRDSPPPGMVWVPGGEFTMGTDSELGKPDEKPAHRVKQVQAANARGD